MFPFIHPSKDFTKSSNSNQTELRNPFPSRKETFYTDPYVTCSKCNHINFVDVFVVRRMLALSKSSSADMNTFTEILPACSKCGNADCFVIGSHDFSANVAARAGNRTEIQIKELNAANTIKKSYRRYQLSMYGAALRHVFLADKCLKYVAATKITAAARGRLGRRIARAERALIVIRDSHPLLVRHSLRTTLRGPKVFWYKRKVEIDMIYKNYLELIEKTGYNPPRKIVEDNIFEIARRVLQRQTTLVSLIQRRWRGFMTRRIVEYFRTEIIRLFQISVSRVMKVQRVYRGHCVRLQLPKWKRERQRSETMDKYISRGVDSMETKVRDRLAAKVKNLYIKEQAEEKTCRYTARIAPASDYNNNKMQAFWDSPYADDRLGSFTDQLLAADRSIYNAKFSAMRSQEQRKRFIDMRIAETGPVGYGLRSIALRRPLQPHDFYVEDDITTTAVLDTTTVTATMADNPLTSSSSKQKINNKGTDNNNSSAVVLNNSNISNTTDTTSSSSNIISTKFSDCCSRSRAMRFYFQAELLLLLNNYSNDNAQQRKKGSKKILFHQLKEYNRKRLEVDNDDDYTVSIKSEANTAVGQSLAFQQKQQQPLMLPSTSQKFFPLLPELRIVIDSTINNNNNNTSGGSMTATAAITEEHRVTSSIDTIESGNNNASTQRRRLSVTFADNSSSSKNTVNNAGSTLLPILATTKKSSTAFNQKTTTAVVTTSTASAVTGKVNLSKNTKKRQHGSSGFDKCYSYPSHVTFDAMKWLYSPEEE